MEARRGEVIRSPTFAVRKSGRGQPHSKTSRKHSGCVARASVLECGCPLPLSLEPLSADRTLQSHPVGYDKSFEKSSQPASNLGVLQCGARSAWLSRAAPALKPQIRSQRQGGLELGASLELGAWCLELWPLRHLQPVKALHEIRIEGVGNGKVAAGIKCAGCHGLPIR